MKFSRVVLIIIPAVLIILAIYAVRGFMTYGRGISPGKADAAIVLGAASYGDRPSPVFRERINHGIWLYRNGFVKKIIFTGARDSADEPPASMVASNYARSRGVPARDILAEDRSSTTEENLLRARDLAYKNGLKTFLVVSDPLHMKRSMMLAEHLGMAARPAPTPTTRYRGFGSRITFLAREIYYYATYACNRQVKNLSRLFDTSEAE